MAEIRSVVNQVLSQLGASREARYYLKQFSSDSLQFAVIKIGGAVMEEQLDRWLPRWPSCVTWV